MSRADELRAELALLELEDEFVAAKEAGEVTAEQKLALREARREFREARAGKVYPGPGEPGYLDEYSTVGEGDAVARPDTVQVSATVQEG